MGWLNTHKRRHDFEGGEIRHAHEHQSSLFLERSLKDAPTYKEVKINGEYFDTRMVTEKKFTVASGYSVMKLLFMPNVVPRNGQLIEIDDDVWLSVHADSKTLAPFNYIRKCTHTIQVKVDRVIHDVPCVLETRVRNTQKLLKLEYVDLSLDSLKITVPYNDITKTIKEKDRFIIDGLAWEVQGYDRITHVENGDGIIEIAATKMPLSVEEEEGLKEDIDTTKVVLTIMGEDTVPQKGETQLTGVITYDGKRVEEGHVFWSSESGLVDENGLFTATCDTGVYRVFAEYEYVDGCDEKQKLKEHMDITVYNNKEWW